MRIHITAVAGTGMGSLAGLLRELGHEVSGSDVAFDPPMGPALKSWGIRCVEGFDPEHLSPAPDLVVIGNVCRRDNPEAAAARERGLETTHIAGALQRFALPATAPLVVAGTHGKTTTSALCAWLLYSCGREPGFLIGGIPNNFGRSFRKAGRPDDAPDEAEVPPQSWPRARPFVIEGDEYDTAYFEKTAKFLHYGAEVAIITSIEHDHIDIYPTFEAYQDAFRRFVSSIPRRGLVVANAADPVVAQLVGEHANARISWFALADEDTGSVRPDWVAALGDSETTETRFDVVAGGAACGRFAFSLTGRHNVKNALAALAATAQGYGTALEDLRQGLRNFTGVRRRQELLGRPRGVFVYDDFAHHPTAVRETLLALRLRHPGRRLLAVFEPRSATACRNLHQRDYVHAFAPADEVLLAPLGRPNLPAAERLDVAELARQLEQQGKPARACESIDEIIAALVARATRGDAIALLSNGAFGGIHKRLLDALA